MLPKLGRVQLDQHCVGDAVLPGAERCLLAEPALHDLVVLHLSGHQNGASTEQLRDLTKVLRRGRQLRDESDRAFTPVLDLIGSGQPLTGTAQVNETAPPQAARLDSGQVTTWTSWHRWTVIAPLAYAFLAVAVACRRARDTDPAELGLIPVTIPELLRQLRGTIIAEPRRDKAHRDAWSLWRRRHQYQAQQAHQRWHAYADALP